VSTLVLVRHGQSDANAAAQLVGRLDPPLTELGRQQAQRVADALGPRAPALVVSSPLQRALQTARAIADAAGCDVTVDERVIELDYGEWDGRGLTDVPPDAWERWRTDPLFAPPGGESLTAVTARTSSAMADLLARNDERPVVVVSHVSPIKAAVTWALDAGVETTWRLRLDLASLTTITGSPHGAMLLAFNATGHLEGL
jgi:broad specificity phosphatase PhoE